MIEDESLEPLKHYMRGMNQVYKDTGRHRYEFSGANGPHTVAKSYTIPMDHLLATGEFPVADLPAPEAFAISLPHAFDKTDQFDISIPVDANAIALASTGKNMILPLPLVDICISAIGGRSDIVESWLKFMDSEKTTDPFQAVKRAATIIGVLLAEAFLNKLSGISLTAWKNSWSILGKFVEIPYFIEMLSLQISGERVKELGELRDAGDPMLRAALIISRTQKRLDDALAIMESIGWPQGRDTPALPLLEIETNKKAFLRPVGQPFKIWTVNPFSKNAMRTPKTAMFVIDRDDHDKFKVMQLTQEMEELFKANPGKDVDIIRVFDSGDDRAVRKLEKERDVLELRQAAIRIAILEYFEWPEDRAVLFFKSNSLFREWTDNDTRIKQITIEIKRNRPIFSETFIVFSHETTLTAKQSSFAETLTPGHVAAYFNGKKKLREAFEKMKREIAIAEKNYEEMKKEKSDGEKESS